MPEFGRKALLPLMAAALATTTVGAQECDIDEGRPAQVSRAFLAVNVALQNEERPNVAGQQLRQAVRLLTENPDRIRGNPVGRNFVLGKALAVWFAQDAVGMVAQRGDLGYTTDPQGTINLPAAIDSAFSAVEAAMPHCAPVTAQWRQQKGWVDLINGAIEKANEEQQDSARVYAEAANLLYSGAPYGHMVLATIAAKERRYERAIELFKRTLEVAESDTAYAEIKHQVRLNFAGMAAEASQDTSGPVKDMLVREARAAYQALAQDRSAGPLSDLGRDGLTRLALAQGDTAAVRASYQDLLQSPDSYGFAILMSSAITAAHADQVRDATAMLEAAFRQNPYHRDVLYNLALMRIRGTNPREAMPLLTRLANVDPSNPDNYRLFWHTWAAIQQGYYDRQRAARDGSPQQAALQDSTRAATDSALKYNEFARAMAARMQVTDFTPRDDGASFSGSILNQGDEPRTFQVTVEFLDARGQAVATERATVGPVAAGSTGRFTVNATAPGILAFRYSPVH
jgi:tetratricopeptide (TPR) repeat protein